MMVHAILALLLLGSTVLQIQRGFGRGMNSLKERQRAFEQSTKERLKSFPKTLHISGAAGILGLFWAAILSLIVLCLVQVQKVTEVEIQSRGKAYLCFKRSVLKQFSLIKKMSKLNQVVLSGHALSVNPKTAALGQAMVQGAQRMQDILNTSYAFPPQGCSSLGHLKNTSPFGLTVTRDLIGLAIFKEKQWTMTTPQERGLKKFELKATLKSVSYRPQRVSLTYSEGPLFLGRVEYWWKLLSGAVSSF